MGSSNYIPRSNVKIRKLLSLENALRGEGSRVPRKKSKLLSSRGRGCPIRTYTHGTTLIVLFSMSLSVSPLANWGTTLLSLNSPSEDQHIQEEKSNSGAGCILFANAQEDRCHHHAEPETKYCPEKKNTVGSAQDHCMNEGNIPYRRRTSSFFGPFCQERKRGRGSR